MLVTVAIVVIPWAILEFGGSKKTWLTLRKLQVQEENRKRALSRNNIFSMEPDGDCLYYAVPLYVMIMTRPLKGMPEIHLGNIFFAAHGNHFEPWSQSMGKCTRSDLRRAKFRVLNSVHHNSVGHRVNRDCVRQCYALANWRFQVQMRFSVLSLAQFIPYQVMIYPIVILLREMGVYGTLTGLVIVHSIFGMPILRCCLEIILHHFRRNCSCKRPVSMAQGSWDFISA